MINHDYECGRCKRIFEAFTDAKNRVLLCPYCHGKADRVYLRFGTMLGKSKGLYPRFDVQLGCTIESSKHMEQIAKTRGLVPMGNEEFKRSRNAPRTPDPFESDEPDPQLIEISKKAWDDVKFGRVPKEIEEKRVVDIAADVLDVKKYEKPSSA